MKWQNRHPEGTVALAEADDGNQVAFHDIDLTDYGPEVLPARGGPHLPAYGFGVRIQ